MLQKSVSIPNGMEFYLKISYRVLMTKCFNSQRDGILLVATLVKRFIVWVSIPNGMEFYYDTLPASEMNLLFQFLMG